MKINRYVLVFLLTLSLLTLFSCRPNSVGHSGSSHEDMKAKELMQGVWFNSDDESVAFRVAGDTIYYPDPASQPVLFQVFRDTLVIYAAQTVKYPILKQSEHTIQFQNQNGEDVTLVKSNDTSDLTGFSSPLPVAVNQNQLIKRDSVVFVGEQRYHIYTQVNPTSYRVVKTTLNEDGLAVDNVYFDNIVNLTIYRGADRFFSSDFRKSDFADFLPADYLSQTVLSDIILERVAADGFHYQVVLAIPDSPTSYVVVLTITTTGMVNKSAVE